MQKPTIPVLQSVKVVRHLIEVYAPERVYLFGSSARGDAGPHGDDDLLLVVSEDATPERKRAELDDASLWGAGASADVLAWTRSRFVPRLHRPTLLPATIIREGRLLHAA